MRVFGYGRVSTAEQTSDNQLLELQQAGYLIQPQRWHQDVCSGKVVASERPNWSKLLEKVEEGDLIVVSKLDRIGRDAIDVLQTIDHLQSLGVKLKVLALGDTDLTSSSGRLILTVLSAVAEMERSLIVERTMAGQARAKAEGKKIGRPSKTTEEQRSEIRKLSSEGVSNSEIARRFGISRASVISLVDGS